MENPEPQERALSDDELQAALKNLGALEGMEFLQRQLALRSREHSESSQLRSEVPNHLELGLTDVVQVVESTELVNEAHSIVQAAESDIVSSLNALFAHRANVIFEQPQAISVTETPHTIDALPANDYAPTALESGTRSLFIPTFANPLPDTQSVPVVTPMVHSDPVPPVIASVPAPIELSPVAEHEPQPEVRDPQPEFPEPVAIDPSADLPSAEEAITAFEEADTTSTAQPFLVDRVILEVGGEEANQFAPVVPAVAEPTRSSAPAAPVESKTVQTAAPGRFGKGIWSLIASWNGTGNLLFLFAAGWVAASANWSLTTVLVGAFAALAATGFGFGTAALAAKRAGQPQSIISRAAFGVRGSLVPLSVVVLTKWLASAVATVALVFALRNYFPSVTKSLDGAGSPVGSFYLFLAALLAVSVLLAFFGRATRLRVNSVTAIVALIWVVAIIVAAVVLSPTSFDLTGALDSAQALAFASVLVIFISLVWGTTAADETPKLDPSISAPQLLGIGLLSNAVIGSVTVLGGFVFFGLKIPVLNAEGSGALLAIFGVLALAHQLRRGADAFAGFGFVSSRGQRRWTVLLSVVFVAGTAVVTHVFVPEQALRSAAVSLLPVVGVPVVAWLAVFGIDSVLRTEEYHEVSLLRSYGFYGKVNWSNLSFWLAAVALGLGFSQSTVPGFTWLGYIGIQAGLVAKGSNADAGVWVAFVVGLVAPLFTLAKIRNQEAEGRALADRHRELVDVLGEL